jgi:hypothetical protein
MEKHFITKILKFSAGKSEGFTYDQVYNIGLSDDEKVILDKYLTTAWNNEYGRMSENSENTMFQMLKYGGISSSIKDASNKFILNLDSLFAFVDFEELRFSKENAEAAKKQAINALKISIFSLAVSVVFSSISIYVTIVYSKKQIEKSEEISRRVTDVRIINDPHYK